MKLPTDKFYEVARPVLESGRAVSFKVSGNSMYPFLKDGETVTIRKKESYGPGDIVLARDSISGGVVLHYVVSKAGNSYKLMGASNLVQKENCELKDIAGGLENPSISRSKIRIWNVMLPVRRCLLWIYRKFDV